jgi:hypothetical protein
MAQLRVYPHRTADARSVSWDSWWIERDGSRSDLPPLLRGWDYASQVTAGVSVSFNEELLLESTGLGSISELEILLLADCRLAQQRFVAREPLYGHDPRATIDVAVQLPAGQVAGDVRLSAHLGLARTAGEKQGRIASLHGARISSSGTLTMRLEGDSGRFPTEAVPFSELLLGNAPWTVDIAYSDLSDSFLGGVRLLINTEHPVAKMALDPKAESRVKGLLHAEVMRLLIAQVASQAEVADESSFEEGSIGQVLDQMFEEVLGGSLKATARLYRDEPKRFELLLHDRLDPFGGIFA